jgi:hypothetical protein
LRHDGIVSSEVNGLCRLWCISMKVETRKLKRWTGICDEPGANKYFDAQGTKTEHCEVTVPSKPTFEVGLELEPVVGKRYKVTMTKNVDKGLPTQDTQFQILMTGYSWQLKSAVLDYAEGTELEVYPGVSDEKAYKGEIGGDCAGHVDRSGYCKIRVDRDLNIPVRFSYR